MSKKPVISFAHFLEIFPEIELPVTLTDDSSRHFSRENDPFPPLVIEQFLVPLEEDVYDEYTEFVPCLRIPNTFQFHAMVYWKAGLMTYDYVLVTYTDKGELIDKKVIAGTKLEGDALAMVVATIDDDWMIHVVGGVSSATQKVFDPSQSQSFHLELLPTGQIIQAESTE